MNRSGLIQDARTGRIHNYVFSVEGDEFVFAPSVIPVSLAECPEQVGSAFFEEFASLHLSTEKRCRKGCAAEKEAAFLSALAAFAKKNGPLFGYEGQSCGGVIREPISTWRTAQSMMDRIMRIQAFVEGANPFGVDDLVVSSFQKVEGYGIVSFALVTDLPVDPLYASCLGEDRLLAQRDSDCSDSYVYWYTDKKIWEGKDLYPRPPFSFGGTMCAAIITIAELSPEEQVDLSDGCFADLSLTEWRQRGFPVKGLGSVVRLVTEAHAARMYLGFPIANSAYGKEAESRFAILTTSFLSYMWYEFAQSYGRSAFRVCANPKCENIIAVGVSRKENRIYCDKGCKKQAGNSRTTEAMRRAREAFYSGKNFADIYYCAFGESMSRADPEYEERCVRLRKWIKYKFSKTKKGKAAIAKIKAQMEAK